MRDRKRKSNSSPPEKKLKQGRYVLLNPEFSDESESTEKSLSQLTKFYGEDSSCESTDSDWESTDSSWSSSFEDRSFHESDCNSEEITANEFSDTTNDSDYHPDIEDIIVSKGRAILHDADDFGNLFSNDETSQIIELEDESIISDSDESGTSCPDLINLETAAFNYNKQECNATFYNCLDRKCVILKFSGTIFFHGVLKVKPIFNSLETNGYTFCLGEESNVSSITNFDYFLNLTSISLKNNENDLKDVLNHISSKLNERDFNQLKMSTDFMSDYSLVYLQAGQISHVVDMLQTYTSISLPLLKINEMSTSELILSTKFFYKNANNHNLIYHKNSQWDNLELTATSKLIIIGGKGVGKSSLVQYLTNENIKKYPKILLVDLDPGQPICSLPQTISATIIEAPLLGKGCLNENLMSPVKCLLYGEKNVTLAPFKYLSCVYNLMQFCSNELELQHIPWIINSMGYQKAMGYQLIAKIIKVVQPTDVVQIQHTIKGFNFQEIITEDIVNRFEFTLFNATSNQCYFTTHVIDSIVNRELDAKWNFNATYKRKLILLCHLAKLLNNNSKHLNNTVPFCHLLSKIQVYVMYQQYESINNDLYAELLNGNVVYLCDNSPDVLNCFGLGIVRAIDRVNDQIFMIMPRNFKNDVLKKISTLSIANLCLPPELLIKQENCNISLPYILREKEKIK